MNVLTILMAATACGLVQSNASGHCWNPPPGVRRMVMGVDISELDLLPLGIAGLNGYKSPVINLTCTSSRVWTSGEAQYQIPDQVWTMTSIPRGIHPSNVHLYKTFADVRNAMTLEVGGRDNIWKFAFSASMSFLLMQNTIMNSKRFISDAAAIDPLSRVDLLPYWGLQLNDYAKEYLEDNIQNNSYTDSPQEYHRFIDQFGTHYFSVANFGGSIRVLHQTKFSYLSSRTDEQARVNARGSFMDVLSDLGSIYSTSSPVDYRFRSDSFRKIKFYGGTTTYLTSSDLQTWQPTVDSAPWLISGELHPTSDLIGDELQRTGMEQAVKQHVLRRYLGELRRLFVVGETKFGEAVNGLGARLAAMEGLPLGNLVEADVETLQRDIESVALVPDWFLENTRLCYNWLDERKNAQCTAGTTGDNSNSSYLCENVGKMTPWYTDKTDNRIGGCRMRWQIESRGHESWFNEVQICHRWTPDKSWSECGNGGSGTRCANVNSYTDWFLDDTTSKPGGCKMSWRLAVPSSAPAWTRKVKMCFSWRPTGDERQCGPAPSRDMCAIANQWTPYYRDNTQGLPGACRMSWALKLDL